MVLHSACPVLTITSPTGTVREMLPPSAVIAGTGWASFPPVIEHISQPASNVRRMKVGICTAVGWVHMAVGAEALDFSQARSGPTLKNNNTHIDV